MPEAPLRVLNDLARELGAQRTVDSLVDTVLNALVTLSSAERAAFALFDGQGRPERVRALGLQVRPDGTLPISASLVRDVLRDGVVCEVTAPAIAVERGRRPSLDELGLQFVVVVPVHVRGRVRGVLYADARSPGPSQRPDRVAVLQALAGVVGLAVENEELANEQRLRSIALAKLLHDLGNPLLVLDLAAAELGMDDEASVVRTALAAMQASVRTAAYISGDERRREPDPTDLAVAPFLEEHVRYLGGLGQAHGILLRTEVAPGLPAVHTWSHRVRLVLENLVVNALKYTPPGGCVTVRAGVRPDPGPSTDGRRNDTVGRIMARLPVIRPTPGCGFVEISVADEGRGIPDELAGRLFDEWVQGENARAGTGLGLAIVDRCVRSLGGRVWVAPAARGTTFAFTLPTAGSAPP